MLLFHSPDAPAPVEDPNHKATYLEPKKAFDDVYWMDKRSVSAWLLTSDDGYILYDTANVYDAEDVLVGGIKKLGLDPAKVRYVIVSHAHRGESGGAYLFQSRYGAHIVTADWDLIDESKNGTSASVTRWRSRSRTSVFALMAPPTAGTGSTRHPASASHTSACRKRLSP